jgi:hypothetical protein
MPKFKIPYESNEWNLSTTALLNMIDEKSPVQVGYTRLNHKMGHYRKWMESLAVNQLEEFVRINVSKIQDSIYKNTLLRGPTIPWHLFWRNELYSLEIIYRLHNGNLTPELLQEWEDQAEGDLTYWEGKLHVATSDFYGPIEPDETVSEHTPYY